MSTIKVDQLADEVMKQLNDFADATCDDMKAAVKKAGNTVRDQIKSTAPNRTGAYAKSWSVKNTKESSHAFEVTVYSRNRYQLAHLLEFGHAKRGGGRGSAKASTTSKRTPRFWRRPPANTTREPAGWWTSEGSKKTRKNE